MKHCKTCQHLFPDQLQVCPQDNTPLRLARELESGMIVRGKYIILELVGTGGMASVYRAKHRLLNEMRAVKVVLSKFAADEDFLRRFRHEAAIARRLRHENAVWVEDLDEIEDGRPFIAMEFLQGQDLRKLIKDHGPLSVERSLRLGSQVAAVLSAAHKLGIVHRDIKPDNIFITSDHSGSEVAKVLDFGIAKAKEGVLQGALTATKTGMIIGTPEYMSPEQAEGRLGDKLDGRADIYSLGVVLYEMLTGQLPFESDTPLGMCMHHLQTPPPPPGKVRPDLRIPEAVSAVLMKALEKRRERRFQSADEMLAALRNPAQQMGNGSGAFAPTKVSPIGIQRVSDSEPTASLATSAAAARPAAAPVTAAAKTSTKKPAIRTGAFSPIAQDAGKRRRIILVALAVIVCAAVGYLLLKVNERRNAALEEHDSLLRQQIVEQLRLSNKSNLTVAVNSGTVTLSGTVPAQADKDSAANLVRSLNGVSDVINNVVVQPVATSPPPPVPQPSNPAGDSATKENRNSKRLSAAAINAITARQQKSDALLKVANDELDQGNYDAAINDFQRAVKLDSTNTPAREGLKRARSAQAVERQVLQGRQP